MINIDSITNFIRFKHKPLIFLAVLFFHLLFAFDISFSKQQRFIPVNLGVIKMVNLQKTTIKKVVENSDKIQEKELITSKTSKKEFAIKKQHLEEKKLAQNPPENKLIDEEEMEGDDKITYKNSGAVDYKIGSVNNPAPNYPKAAFRRGHEGNVDICAEVDSNGDPLKVNICSSSGYKSLDYAALKTIKNWKFSIKSKILHSVYYVKVPINFSISS